MKIIKWLDENLEKVLCMFLISLMTLIIFIQVIMRYIFRNSLVWSEELARYLFIYLVFIGASYGCKQMSHIKIDAALGIFPKKVRPYIAILGNLLVLILASYIVVTGIELVQFQMIHHKITPALELPMAFVDAAPVIGFGLIIIRQIQALLYQVCQLKKDKIKTEEGKSL